MSTSASRWEHNSDPSRVPVIIQNGFVLRPADPQPRARARPGRDPPRYAYQFRRCAGPGQGRGPRPRRRGGAGTFPRRPGAPPVPRWAGLLTELTCWADWKGWHARRVFVFGRAVSIMDPPFWVVANEDGAAVAEIDAFLLDFWASGNAESSCRSYAFGLLRWYRHLHLTATAWDRAVRETVRDFVLACKQPSSLCPRPLAPRTINHNLAVISAFYTFHIGQQQGPLVNPVPERGRAGHERFAAHHNPETPFRLDRRADLRQRVPQAAPRSLPKQIVTELFRVLDHPRDRVLLAFYLSSAARPSELLGARTEDVDPGNQQITVVRKGTRARQVVPASTGAFPWLRLYQESLPAELTGPGNPVWWTLRWSTTRRSEPQLASRGNC